jgi:hypothetical protein
MISNTALIIILVLFGFITLIVFLRAVLFSKQERAQTLRRRRRNMIYPEQILMQPNIMQPNIIMETEETMVQPETNANTNTPTPYEMV